MMDNIPSARVAREAETQPDLSSSYHSLLAHGNNRYWHAERLRIFARALGGASTVLEIGCTGWVPYIEETGLRPKKICCINIHKPHLDEGTKLAEATVNKPDFLLMDAHKLDFADGTFDAIFGCAILHHLQVDRAISEFKRVLRPGGAIWFDEPLGTNPIGNFVRSMTPGSHTPDEEPLTEKHFRVIRTQFKLNLHYQQLFTVPAALISTVLFRSSDNALMRSAYLIDKALLRVMPGIGNIYRYVIVDGQRRN